MGVNPTPSNFKTFTFDNTNSAQYGVYITGQGVFNAPERNVEMVEIPGRDGAYALDKGNFNNIEVTYPAGIVADTEADFATAVSNLRNFLCSKTGYCRLTDDYNSGEYRMAVYKSGLDVSHEGLRTGEFDITFECKPQRWLTSGETKTSVANNGTITNPTLFESRPTLEFQGYGDITLGGQTVSVANVPIGNVLLANSENINIEYPDSSTNQLKEVLRHTIDVSQLNANDVINLDATTFSYVWTSNDVNDTSVQSTISNQTGNGVNTVAVKQGDLTVSNTTTFDAVSFTKGTSSTITHTYSESIKFYDKNGGYFEINRSETVQIDYDGTDTITLSAKEENKPDPLYPVSGISTLGAVNGYSTKSASGTKTIDLDIGEAYWNNSGTITSLNFAVTLPPKLPTLASGSNTITYPNTITNFKITPHWWKV